MIKNIKIRSNVRFIALFIILFGLSLNIFLTNFNSKNIPFTEESSNDFERDFQYSNLKNQALSSDNIYDGIGAPWNVSHWANRTDYDLPVSFGNGSSDTANMDLGSGWEGYQLNGIIKNLYDTRNWVNGTFHEGADDDTELPDENDSDDVLNWTFGFYDYNDTNDMSGNYNYSEITNEDFLELQISKRGNVYDNYDKCWWNSSVKIPRGKVIGGDLFLSVYPHTVDDFANVFSLEIYLNDEFIYGIGLYTIQVLAGGPNWVDLSISLESFLDNSKIFPNPINNTNMNITVQLRSLAYVPASVGNKMGDSERIFFDNVSLILQSEIKPEQFGLRMNNQPVSDIDWGNGTVGQISSWSTTPVDIKFNTSEVRPPEMGGYEVEFKTDLNLFARKMSDDSDYLPNFNGTRFEVRNDSLVEWQSYARVSVPTGYEETNVTIEFPEDLNITWISNAEYPDTNILKYCDNSTLGILKVSNFSETPDGFWWVKGISPNYCSDLNIYNNATGSWLLNNEFLSGDYINITAKITNSPLISGYIQQTNAKLHIRFPNGTIWTGQTQMQTPDSNGLIDFNYFQIPGSPPNYEAGEYELIVTWNNSFSTFKLNETGIIYKKFTVIHESTLQPDQGISFIENVIDYRVINIKVPFNDKIDNSAIENALVYTNFSNQIHYFSEISPGFYLFEFNASEADPGNNTLTIYANATFYVNNILNITVDVVKETLLTFENDFLTVSWNQNFTLRFNYTEKADPGIGINTSAISIDWIGEYHLIQTSIGRYELTCNPSAYSALTLQSFVITLNAYNYQAQSKLIRVQINELGSILELYLNGVLSTSNDKIAIDLYQQINITVKYLDSLSSNHINNASIKIIGGQFSTNLTENQQLEQYTIIISGIEFGPTIDTLSVFAKKENYDLQIIPFLVEVTEKQTEIQLFLNGDNKTSDPLVELPIGATLNLTVKYTDETGNHMGGADVQLVGDDFTEDLIENLNLKQYTLNIDTTEDLYLGVNILTVVAQGLNIQTKTINPRITIRRIFADISTVSGDLIISIETGGNAALNVILNNTDFGGLIKNATVKYSWAFGTGDLLDTNNDGIYSYVLRDVPEGSYAIIITAFVNDNYYFESYEIIVTAITITTDDTLFQILFIISIIGAAALGSYLIVYQRVLKYPKAVRKVRKYRKTLKRQSAPSVHIISQEKAFKTLYKEEVVKTQKIKTKPTEPVPEVKKPIEKKPIETPKEKSKETTK